MGYSPALNLIPAVLDLSVFITRGGGWSLGLQVQNLDGTPADLTGITASLLLPGGVVWTALTTGAQFTWDVPKTLVDALTISVGEASLIVTDGAHTSIWAKGKAVLR